MANYGQLGNEGEVSGTPLAPVNMQPVDSFVGGILGQMQKAGEGTMGEIGEAMKETYNYRMEEDAKDQMNAIQNQAEAEAKEGMESAPGSAKSWFLEDGTLDKDKVADFQSRYKEAYDGVNPALWGNEAQIRWGKMKGEYLRNSERRLVGQTVAGQLEATKRVANAALENALVKGDMKAFATEAYRQAGVGILTRVEAENKILKAARSRLVGGGGGGGSLNVGGHVANGFNARLFADGARQGIRPMTEEQYDREGREAMLKRMQEYVRGERDDLYGGPEKTREEVMQEVTGGKGIEGITDVDLEGEGLGLKERSIAEGSELLPSNVQEGNKMLGMGASESEEILRNRDEEITLTPGQKWAFTGDSADILQGMTEADYDSVQAKLSENDNTITLKLGQDGVERLEAGVYTSEPVQAIVAGANERGGLSKEEAYEAADDIATTMAISSPGVSAAAIVKALDALCVPLGDGDAEAGKLELQQVVAIAKQRADKTNFTIMPHEAIKSMAEMTVKGKGYRRDEDGKELDWSFFERLDREIKKKKADERDAWEIPHKVFGSYSEEEKMERDNWERAFKHFLEHVNDYNPQFSGKSNDWLRKKFEEIGGDYVQWWNEEYGEAAKKEAEKHAIAMLEARIKQSQQMHMEGNKDYNYVNDADIAKSVCMEYNGIDRRTNKNISLYHREQVEIMKNTQEIIRMKQERFQKDMAKVRMQGELNEEAKAEQKKQEMAQKRAEEKAAKEAEETEQRIQMKKYLEERNKPKLVDWEFDNVDRGDFGGMMVRLPADEWRRVQEDMGYNPEIDTVTLKIDGIGQNIYVDMTCPARGNSMECSAALVAKFQQKPTGRGKNKIVPPLMRRGRVGVRYVIKKAPKE